MITHDLVRMVDLSAVRANDGLHEVRKLAEEAKKHNCICAFDLDA